MQSARKKAKEEEAKKLFERTQEAARKRAAEKAAKEAEEEAKRKQEELERAEKLKKQKEALAKFEEEKRWNKLTPEQQAAELQHKAEVEEQRRVEEERLKLEAEEEQKRKQEEEERERVRREQEKAREQEEQRREDAKAAATEKVLHDKMEEDKKKGERWVLDTEVNQCMRCQEDFGMTNRRHHCRACGFVVCAKCSTQREKLCGSDHLHRVCQYCSAGFAGGKERPYPTQPLPHGLFGSQRAPAE